MNDLVQAARIPANVRSGKILVWKDPGMRWQFLILTVRFLSSGLMHSLILHLLHITVNKTFPSFHWEHSGSKESKKRWWILRGC